MIDLYTNRPELETCRGDIERAAEMMETTYRNGGKLLVCGNGGSCADAEHIVGELMKGFLRKRRMSAEEAQRISALFPEDAEHFAGALQKALPAIALTAHTGLTSAYINDEEPDMVYAQQVYGYGKPGDLFIGISTSGNSANVVNAAKMACIMGLQTVALTGARESKLSAVCACTIRVPETETYRVQELHLPVYHYLCAKTEEVFFGQQEKL